MVEHRGYRVIIRRSGEVVVEGRTADGRPPIGCIKATDRVVVGVVHKPPGKVWATYRPGEHIAGNISRREDAARLLVDHVIAAGMPRGLRPFKEAT